MTTNDRLLWAGVAVQAVVLALLVWVAWILREKADEPALSGVKIKAFTTSDDGLPPREVTVELYVDDTEAEWLERLDTALRGLEKRR